MHRTPNYRPRPGRHRRTPRRTWPIVAALTLINTIVLATALLAATPAHANPIRPASTGGAWATRADRAIDAAIARDDGTGTAFAYSWLASAIAHRHGWDDPRARRYLGLALDQQHANGGYGLNYAWDAFGDGTINPASTNYTITYYQVGEVALEAYKAGAVPYTTVTDFMRGIVTSPILRVKVGMGIAYSNSRYDIRNDYMVHNIAQAAAMFLADAQHAGITWSSAQVAGWVAALTRQELSTYQVDLHGWPYRTGGSQAVQDAAHNALGVAMLMVTDRTQGIPALHWAMTHDLGATGAIAHAFLGQFTCSPRWLGEFDQAQAASGFQYLTQFARSAALNAQACSGSHDLGGWKQR